MRISSSVTKSGVYYDWVYDGIWKTEEAEEAAKYRSEEHTSELQSR